MYPLNRILVVLKYASLCWRFSVKIFDFWRGESGFKERELEDCGEKYPKKWGKGGSSGVEGICIFYIFSFVVFTMNLVDLKDLFKKLPAWSISSRNKAFWYTKAELIKCDFEKSFKAQVRSRALLVQRWRGATHSTHQQGKPFPQRLVTWWLKKNV